MVLLNGNAKLLTKICTGSQIVWIQKIHDRPQFGEPVLYGCSCQSNSMPGIEAAYCSGLLGTLILYILRLIQHNVFPLNRRKMLLITQGKGIRSDYNIVLSCLFPERLIRKPFRPVMNHDRECRRETLKFPVPVAHDRHWTNYKSGTRL